MAYPSRKPKPLAGNFISDTTPSGLTPVRDDSGTVYVNPIGIQESIVPASKIQMGPDSDCSFCAGTGHEFLRGATTECRCVYKKRILQYLTPMYANTVPSQACYHSSEFDSKQILLEAITAASFKTIVASFLLRHLATLSHTTVTGFHAFNMYFAAGSDADPDGAKFRTLSEVDVLILSLVSDPPVKTYPDLFANLIDTRGMKPTTRTWIYAPDGVKSARFEKLYGASFRAYLAGSDFYSPRIPNF